MVKVPKVRVMGCTSVPQKSDQGISVSVTWYSSNPLNRYRIKFSQEENDGTTKTITKSGVQGSSYTETNLRHGTMYKVTVSLVGNPESESGEVSVKTLPTVTCKFFKNIPKKKKLKTT